MSKSHCLKFFFQLLGNFFFGGGGRGVADRILLILDLNH